MLFLAIGLFVVASPPGAYNSNDYGGDREFGWFILVEIIWLFAVGWTYGVFGKTGAIIAHFVIGGIGGAVMGLVFHQPDSNAASNTPASPEVRRRRTRVRMKRDAHLSE